MKTQTSIFVLAQAMLFFLGENGLAQNTQMIPRDQPSRYVLGQEEQMLLPVNILGMVQKPGQYMVPYRTDLVSLIAYAGGFREDAKITEVKILRNVSLTTKSNGTSTRHTRPRSRVLRVDIKRYFDTGDQSRIPQLMPDDTVIVGGTAARHVNKVFDFLRNLVIVGQLAFYVTVALNQ